MRDVSIDTETFLIAPGLRAPPLVCGSAAYLGEEPILWRNDDPEWWTFVERVLREDRIVGANIAYDMCVLVNERPELLPLILKAYNEDRIIDIQNAEKLKDIRNGCFRVEEDEFGEVKRKGYSLGELSHRILGEEMDKDTFRMRYHDFFYTPVSEMPAGAQHYAKMDASGGRRIWEKQKDYLHATQLAPTCRAGFALALASARGMRTDPVQVDLLRTQTEAKIKKLQPLLIEIDWIYPNANVACGWSKRTKIIKEYAASIDIERVYTSKGIELIAANKESVVVGKSEYLSLSYSTLADCGDEHLQAYARFNRLTNLLNTTIKHLRAGRLIPIQSRFDELLATTRTSSSGPNVQNVRVDEGVRQCFVARPGFAFVSADYGMAELHTLAQFCYDQFGKSAQGDALNKGMDVHCLMAARLLGCPYEEARAGYKAEKASGTPGRFTDARNLGKNCNFALPGAAGAKRFSSMVNNSDSKMELSVQEAAKAIAQWKAQWPEMALFFKYVDSCRMRHSSFNYAYVERMDFVRGNCTFPAACNTHFQAPAAAGAKDALWELTEASFDLQSPFYGCRIVNFVHDEIIVEAPVEKVDAAAKVMVEVMERRFNAYVPNCPTTADAVAMYAWDKNAKPAHNQNGELIPWEDAR